MSSPLSRADLRARLREVTALLQRHRTLETFASKQQTPKRDLLEQLQGKQNLASLRKYLHGLHPADLALLLEALPAGDRELVWRRLLPIEAGLVLVELDEEVRAGLLESIDRADLVGALVALDADDLNYLSEFLPKDVVREVTRSLSASDQLWVQDAQAYAEDSVGRLMTREVVTATDDQTIGQASASLRAYDDLPPGVDRLFVIDARHVLKGTMPLHVLLTSDPETPVASVTATDVRAFTPHDHAADAAKTFERYDLISAPVVDERGKLIGRVTIDAVVDHLREASEQSALTRAGLRGAEDLFATVPDSIRNRWPWLCLNLVTAFAASRVIGVFEGTIAQFAALATLMPIVASIGGNTGNQTVALVVRAMALDELHGTEWRLARKELIVAGVNGVVWGAVVGAVASWLYASAGLGLVMMAAVILNLVVAALAGLAVPLGLRWAHRDPAHGASVILTFVTDSAGFFLFLGLARVFLV